MILSNPPYLQIALDLTDHKKLEYILHELPSFSSQLLIEAGTPLIKKFGSAVIEEIRAIFPEVYIIADLKTLDVGWLEVQIGAEAGANAIAVSGLAPIETIESALTEAKKRNVDIILDLMNVKDPLPLLESLSSLPAIVLFHRGIDQEGNQEHPWELIHSIRNRFNNILVAVAGGLNLETSNKALNRGADIIIIGRAITQSSNVRQATEEFLKLLECNNNS